jgi:tetratricopeptide (TPR) repeat protein
MRPLWIGVVVSSLWLGALGSARADSLADVFARGNAAFARGDYAAAILEYEQLTDSGIDDPEVAFNLASSYGAAGQYGQAIRYFERTLRLAPGDGAAREGLRLARDSLGERQAQKSGEAIVVDRPPLTEAVFSYLSANTLAVLLLLTSWLGAGLLIGLSWVRLEAARLGVGIAAAVCFGLALLSAIGVGAKADWGRDGQRAVVIREGAALREGPDPSARLLGELSEGEAVRLLAREGRFARVLARSGARDGADAEGAADEHEPGLREAYVLGTDVGEI